MLLQSDPKLEAQTHLWVLSEEGAELLQRFVVPAHLIESERVIARGKGEFCSRASRQCCNCTVALRRFIILAGSYNIRGHSSSVGQHRPTSIRLCRYPCRSNPVTSFTSPAQNPSAKCISFVPQSQTGRSTWAIHLNNPTFAHADPR